MMKTRTSTEVDTNLIVKGGTNKYEHHNTNKGICPKVVVTKIHYWFIYLLFIHAHSCSTQFQQNDRYHSWCPPGQICHEDSPWTMSNATRETIRVAQLTTVVQSTFRNVFNVKCLL